MIHEAGHMRTPVPVGKAYNSYAYPIIGAYYITIAAGSEAHCPHIARHAGHGALAYKIPAGCFHAEVNFKDESKFTNLGYHTAKISRLCLLSFSAIVSGASYLHSWR
jgi:hypothetical protein